MVASITVSLAGIAVRVARMMTLRVFIITIQEAKIKI
jgi:hypothetical protein